MELTRQYPRRGEDLLYPMMLIAAIAVIAFSVLGMASISGWMPRAMVGTGSAMTADTMSAATSTEGVANAAPAFRCAECGVIESVREIGLGTIDNTVLPQG